MSVAEQDPKLAWMEINTFECPHGLGRLSPESCAELRNRPDISQATGAPHPSKPGKDYRPKACRSCTRYQEMWDLVARRRAGSEQQIQTESEAMPTYIDCLCCDRQDVPNQARGLCQHCYPLVPANRRDRYSLEDAKRKRQGRLNREEMQDSRNGQDPDPQEQSSEPQEPGEPESPESFQNSDGDPLAGFEFVPCDNSCIYSQEASVDPHGKSLRIGRKAARKAGLQPNTYVHLYRGKSSLALKVLQDPDSRSYKLSQDGGPKRAENCKVTLSAKKLVKGGAIYPGQRFRVRPHESGKIIYLDAIEERGTERQKGHD